MPPPTSNQSRVLQNLQNQGENSMIHSSLHGQSGLRFRSTPLLGNSQYSNNKIKNQSSQNQSHIRRVPERNTISYNGLGAGDDIKSLKSTLPYVAESQLYNEVLYILRGVEQTHIKRNKNEDAYRIAPNANINPRHLTALNKLCEMGWLHDKIYSYQQSAQQSRARFGKTGQALGYRIHGELKEYYECLSNLSDYQVDQERNLVQLLTGTTVVRSRLKYLAVIIENCGQKKGSALLSILSEFIGFCWLSCLKINISLFYFYLRATYLFPKHLGDPLIRQLSKELFHSAVQPFLQVIQVWLNEGDLTDDYGEFFIAEGTSLEATRSEKFWNEAFDIKIDQIPSFLDEKMCRKILNTGKSVNFLKTICKDRDFGNLYNYGSGRNLANFASKANKREYLGNYKYNMNEIIPNLVHKSYFNASSALLKCLREKYDLNLHLIMMRNYLLLGQGDFIRHLLDQLKDELDKQANLVYNHNLKDIVDAALRISACHPEASNGSTNDQNLLDRLTVKLLEHHPGETGWDIFCLDYVIEDSSPLKAIFSPAIFRSYLRLFQFLWRAKRMEHIVAISWTELSFQAKHASKNLPEAVGLLHKCQLVLQEQMHYLSQIQYYVTFEVLECSWADFQENLKNVKDFDELLAAHEAFLDKLLGSCLLKPSSQNISGKIRSTFDSVAAFQDLLVKLNNECEQEISRREISKKKTGWEFNEEEMSLREEFKIFVRSKLIPQVEIRKAAWNSLVTDMLSSLLSEEDEYLRSLAWRLDFSRHYYKV